MRGSRDSMGDCPQRGGDATRELKCDTHLVWIPCRVLEEGWSIHSTRASGQTLHSGSSSAQISGWSSSYGLWDQRPPD